MPGNRRIKYFISGIVEHIFVQAAVCLPFVCHLTNYEFPVAIKRENLRSPVISKLSANYLCGRQCVVSDFDFTCL